MLGNSNGAGEENRDVARMAVLLAGLPVEVPGATVNRLCGSGMEAAVAANRAIAVGDASICIAGGVESMSRAPWVVQKPEKGFERTDRPMVSTTLGWRLVNPEMPSRSASLGDGAELLARGTTSAAKPRTSSPSRATAARRQRGSAGPTTTRRSTSTASNSTETSPSAPTRRWRSWRSSSPRSARTAASRPATPHR